MESCCYPPPPLETKSPLKILGSLKYIVVWSKPLYLGSENKPNDVFCCDFPTCIKSYNIFILSPVKRQGGATLLEFNYALWYIYQLVLSRTL